MAASSLIARTDRKGEQPAAEDLSEALGGLPLAHEQAAAYCERLEIPLAEYRRRFAATPTRLLDTERDAPAEYHDKLTVAKTFALAIDEAAKLHPAAEPLIVRAALLAPEPIPLFLFAEEREKFSEPFASALADDGLDEAVAALRTVALVDRETIVDERDPAVATDTIRLHRLVREVSAARLDDAAQAICRTSLIMALSAVYPRDVDTDVRTWPRARRLNSVALNLVASKAEMLSFESVECDLMHELATFHRVIGAYAQAEPLYRRLLGIYEREFGPDHAVVAAALANLGLLLREMNRLADAKPLLLRAFKIDEATFGPNHLVVARDLNNIALVLQDTGQLDHAEELNRRVLAIFEENAGPSDRAVTICLCNLARLLAFRGRREEAEPLYRRALAIDEGIFGPIHTEVGIDLYNLAVTLHQMNQADAAEPLYRRSLAIREELLGPEHPNTLTSVNNLANCMEALGDAAAALPLYRRALDGFASACLAPSIRRQ